MTATCNWDRTSGPMMEDYPKMEFYDASTINETLKSKDIARMKALKRTLWLKVHHLKDAVTNARVAYGEAIRQVIEEIEDEVYGPRYNYY